MISKVTKNIILVFALFVFFLGIGSYFVLNGASLVSLTVGHSIEEDTEYIEVNHVELTAEPEVEEVFMEFPSAPLDFLDETLPFLEPDPTRAHGVISEIVVDGGTQISNFFVNDTSNSGINLVEVLSRELPFEITNMSEPTVLIYHTHTNESYLTGYTDFYYTDYNGRNADTNRNIVQVGIAMTEALEAKGINVIHDTTVHDSPAYNGAYDRSLETVQNILAENPSITITIDIHRDSMTTSEGVKYKPTANIDGRKAAQVMILAGSDATGALNFPNWEENLVLSLQLQEKATEMYPDLMRPLMFCERRYNMHVTNASLLFEVGTEVNTLAEAKYSAELMANVLYEVIK